MIIGEALPQLYPDEGVWSNDANDPGGETVFGISRVKWPNWSGWIQVDHLKAASVPVLEWKNSIPLMAAVKPFYQDNFWLPAHIDYLPASIQFHAFECAVNQGVEGFVRFLQQALVRLEYPIVVDGVMGPSTLAGANTVRASQLADAFQLCREDAYLTLANEHPEKRSDLRGWFNRVRGWV